MPPTMGRDVRATVAGYPEPPATGDEATTLLGSLERQRATFAWKCAGLDADGLAATVGTSSMTLGGLLKHLAWMEDSNFTHELGGGQVPAPWDAVPVDARDAWAWRSAADDEPEALYDLWDDAVSRSRIAVFRALANDGLGGQFTTSSGATCSLRRLAVDLVEEYARHTGHADVLREAVDGRVGEDPPGPRQAYRLPS